MGPPLLNTTSANRTGPTRRVTTDRSAAHYPESSDSLTLAKAGFCQRMVGRRRSCWATQLRKAGRLEKES
jgi:hypothetical protein